MKRISTLIFLISISAIIAHASDGLAKDSTKQEELYTGMNEIIWSGIGAGWGLDYGGFGANYTAYLSENIGFFAGLGYAYAGVGYNFGLKVRMLTRREGSKINPFVLGMFGFNQAFTASTDSASLSKVMTGFTVGIGTDYRFKQGSKGYWSVALFWPFMNEDAEDTKNWLEKNIPGNYHTWVNKVGFSIGYHYIIRSR